MRETKAGVALARMEGALTRIKLRGHKINAVSHTIALGERTLLSLRVGATLLPPSSRND
jgi:hypothetical protein